jgi:DNA-binding MarR family transcriptional regulator
MRRRLTYFIKLAETVQRSITEPRLRTVGISYTQLVMLTTIAAEPNISSAELARRNGTTPQATGEIVGALLRNGWIRRIEGKVSRKVLHLELLAAGEAILKRADTVLDAIERELTAGLDQAQIETTKRLLDELIQRNRLVTSRPS